MCPRTGAFYPTGQGSNHWAKPGRATTYSWRVIYGLGFRLPRPLSCIAFCSSINLNLLTDRYHIIFLGVFCSTIFTLATREITLVISCVNVSLQFSSLEDMLNVSWFQIMNNMHTHTQFFYINHLWNWIFPMKSISEYRMVTLTKKWMCLATFLFAAFR